MSQDYDIPLENLEPSAEAVVAVFETAEQAQNALDVLKEQGIESIELAQLNKRDSQDETNALLNDLHTIFYDEDGDVKPKDVMEGIVKGGAIGAASGLVFIAVPGFNILAPIGGFFGGALIGGMASIDEGQRSTHLPCWENYRSLVRQGHGLILVIADESTRAHLEKEFMNAGATAVHQHPPLGHMIRNPRHEVSDHDVPDDSPHSQT